MSLNSTACLKCTLTTEFTLDYLLTKFNILTKKAVLISLRCVCVHVYYTRIIDIENYFFNNVHTNTYTQREIQLFYDLKKL